MATTVVSSAVAKIADGVSAFWSFDQFPISRLPFWRDAARDDAATTEEDAVVSIDVLANDTPIHGAFSAISSIEGRAISVGDTVWLDSGARVTLRADGDLRYDPTQSTVFDRLEAGETAIDTFVYGTMSGGAFASATVHVSVRGVDDPADAAQNPGPIAVDDFFVAGPTASSHVAPGVTWVSATAKATGDGSASAKAVVLAPAGDLDFETDIDVSAIASVIGAADASIVARPKSAPTPDAAPRTMKLDVLLNDRDADADALAIGAVNGQAVSAGEVVMLATGATLTVSEDGSLLVYSGGVLGYETPEGRDALATSNVLRSEMFSYQAFDGTSYSNPADVLVVENAIIETLIA